jgi:hypothetical protein
LGEQGGETIHNALPVVVVEEHITSFNTANHEVLEQSGELESGEARHGRR